MPIQKLIILSVLTLLTAGSEKALASAGKRFSDSACMQTYINCEETNNSAAWRARDQNKGYSESAASLQCYTALFVCKDEAAEAFGGRPHVNGGTVQDLEDAIDDFTAKSPLRTQALEAYQAKVDAYVATIRAASLGDAKSDAFYKSSTDNLLKSEPQSAGLPEALTLVSANSPSLKKLVELKVKIEDVDLKLSQTTDPATKNDLTILRKSLEINALNYFHDFDDLIATYFDKTNGEQFFKSELVSNASLPIKNPCTGEWGFKGDLLKEGKLISFIFNGDSKSGIPALSTKCTDKVFGDIKTTYSASKNEITFRFGRRGGLNHLLDSNMNFDISRHTNFSGGDYLVLDQIRKIANSH